MTGIVPLNSTGGCILQWFVSFASEAALACHVTETIMLSVFGLQPFVASVKTLQHAQSHQLLFLCQLVVNFIVWCHLLSTCALQSLSNSVVQQGCGAQGQMLRHPFRSRIHRVRDHRVRQRSSYQLLEGRVAGWPSVSCRCRQGVEQSAVNSHCCVNPAFIPLSPENSSIHRIFPTILVTLSAFWVNVTCLWLCLVTLQFSDLPPSVPTRSLVSVVHSFIHNHIHTQNCLNCQSPVPPKFFTTVVCHPICLVPGGTSPLCRPHLCYTTVKFAHFLNCGYGNFMCLIWHT